MDTIVQANISDLFHTGLDYVHVVFGAGYPFQKKELIWQIFL